MTLTPCRSCGREVAPTARACPQCGDARPGRAALTGERHEMLTVLFALVAASIAISLIAALWR